MGAPQDRESVEWHELSYEDVPCCTICGRPYVRGQYYCEHCGTVVGNLTPYIPYVNIPFNYGPFRDMWRGLIGAEKMSLGKRIVSAVVIGTNSFGIFVLAGLPFAILDWVRRKRRRQCENLPPDTSDPDTQM